MARAQVKHTKKSRKRFTPLEIEQVKADWLNCRNANDCAKRHGISPRTVHNWIKKFDWLTDGERVDAKAETLLLQRATEERVSLIERVQRINDKILNRLEEATLNPTLADFREGVKLESSLLSESPEDPVQIDEREDLENNHAYQRILKMTPYEMADEYEKLARRIRESADIERKRQSLMAS